jgi:hypothetical protein
MGGRRAGAVILATAMIVGCQREAEGHGEASVEAVLLAPFEGKVFDTIQAACGGATPSLAPAGRYADVPYDPEVFLAMQREDMAAKNRAEAPALLSTLGRARRKGDVLTVSSGRFVDRTREEHNDAASAYRYLGRIDGAPIDVVHGVLWESETWTLVDIGGRAISMAGTPVASPKGGSFAAAGGDVDGEGLSGVQIADYRDGVFKLVDLDAPPACDPRWIDENTLELSLARSPDASERMPSNGTRVRVVRDGAGWKLVPPAT